MGTDKLDSLHIGRQVDGSVKTGCFDATWPGFVQVSKDIALGAAIYPISNPTGLPSQITIFIFKDPNTGNWWVNYGESQYRIMA
ncbi:unnamed protein product [Coffea canephora]|uniref:DH200=94 genomic scaffold, scaffold_812 n=1 Tax=Coffea canephora TaxID=49390 RepID=A0A068VHB4_COFCA|nr:unnamed protein product [Coffea canephora]